MDGRGQYAEPVPYWALSESETARLETEAAALRKVIADPQTPWVARTRAQARLEEVEQRLASARFAPVVHMNRATAARTGAPNGPQETMPVRPYVPGARGTGAATNTVTEAAAREAEQKRAVADRVQEAGRATRMAALRRRLAGIRYAYEPIDPRPGEPPSLAFSDSGLSISLRGATWADVRDGRVAIAVE